jgi:regulatory protein
VIPQKPESRPRRGRRPLDQQALERLALHYVGRFGTTSARLHAYLARKVRERGWSGEVGPAIDPIVEHVVRLGYVDDAAFAAARAAAMQRRGYGQRRISAALAAAGITADERAKISESGHEAALAAALRFAQRRKLGPYALEKPDKAARQRGFAAMVRAGHPIDIVRSVIDAEPGEVPDQDGI